MVSRLNSTQRLAEIALVIADTFSLDTICNALETGRLTKESTAATRAVVADGNAVVENCLRALQEAWALANSEVSGQVLSLVLRASVGSVLAFRQQVPSTQVVWTGPKVEGSFLRATREVVREIIRGAQTELLVVGYWIAARNDGEGIIEEVINSLADAVSRCVEVRVVVDERVRLGGGDNRRVLVSTWPTAVPLPRILTWRLPPGDQHLKLHAKVLVADRRDALVTSANLTSFAMDKNMEMGVRINGHPAGDIAKHFDLLEAREILELYGDERCAP